MLQCSEAQRQKDQLEELNRRLSQEQRAFEAERGAEQNPSVREAARSEAAAGSCAMGPPPHQQHLSAEKKSRLQGTVF